MFNNNQSLNGLNDIDDIDVYSINTEVIDSNQYLLNGVQLNTSHIPEDTNLYFTNQRAIDALIPVLEEFNDELQTKVSKTGDTMTGTLNITDIEASNNTLNLGVNASTINIGTASTASTINIGSSPSDVVNIYGNLTTISTTNTDIYDKNITLNKGSTTSASARGAGISIRDNNTDNQGYITVNGTDGQGFDFKAPENTGIVRLRNVGGVSSDIVLTNGSQTIAGIKTFTNTINCNGNLNAISGRVYTRDALFGGSSIINTQGCNIQWNKEGGRGRSYIINQKGGGGQYAGISFGESDTSNNYTQNMLLFTSGELFLGNTSILTPRAYKFSIETGDINLESGLYRIGGNQISTSNVLEGSNLYYTDARARNAITGSTYINYNNTNGVISFNNSGFLSSITTDNITEGTTNKYITNQRVIDAIEHLNYIIVDNITPRLLSSGLTIGDNAGFKTLELLGSTINIGNPQYNSIINFYANKIYNLVANDLNIENKFITLNKNGGIATSGESGIYIEENNAVVAYAKVDVYRTAWEFKCPERTQKFLIEFDNSGQTFVLNKALVDLIHDPLTLDTNTNGLYLINPQVLGLRQASGTQTGALSSTDWNTFNNKENALTFLSPLSRSTNTISMSQANASTNGFLSSTDWNIFNNKLNSSGGTISGALTVSGSSSLNGTYINTNFGNTTNRPLLVTAVSSLPSYEIRARSNATNTFGDDGFLRLVAGGGTNSNVQSYIELSGYSTVPDMDKNIVFGTSGTQRMRITGGGNVIIGTGTTTTNKLDVAGNINISTGSNYLINGSQIGADNIQDNGLINRFIRNNIAQTFTGLKTFSSGINSATVTITNNVSNFNFGSSTTLQNKLEIYGSTSTDRIIRFRRGGGAPPGHAGLQFSDYDNHSYYVLPYSNSLNFNYASGNPTSTGSVGTTILKLNSDSTLTINGATTLLSTLNVSDESTFNAPLIIKPATTSYTSDWFSIASRINSVNRSKTYLVFAEDTPGSDVALLRQINPEEIQDNRLHISLDFVDTITVNEPPTDEGGFSIRRLDASGEPDGTHVSLFHVRKKTGNVGIGITAPTQKLDVSGNINISNGSNYLINGVQLNTSHIPENTNLYYTDTRVQNLVNPVLNALVTEISNTYVKKVGDTMTGTLLISNIDASNTTLNIGNNSTNVNIGSDNITINGSTTCLSTLTLSADPYLPLQCATKQYVDNNIGSLSQSKWLVSNNDLYPLSNNYNVSIGTSTNTSNYKLNVNGNAYISNGLTVNTGGINSSSPITCTGGNMIVNNERAGFIADTGGNYRFGLMKYLNRVPGLWMCRNNPIQIGHVRVDTLLNTPATFDTRIHIASDGKIGMGTTDPQHNVDIYTTSGNTSLSLNNSVLDFLDIGLCGSAGQYTTGSSTGDVVMRWNTNNKLYFASSNRNILFLNGADESVNTSGYLTVNKGSALFTETRLQFKNPSNTSGLFFMIKNLNNVLQITREVSGGTQNNYVEFTGINTNFNSYVRLNYINATSLNTPVIWDYNNNFELKYLSSDERIKTNIQKLKSIETSFIYKIEVYKYKPKDTPDYKKYYYGPIAQQLNKILGDNNNIVNKPPNGEYFTVDDRSIHYSHLAETQKLKKVVDKQQKRILELEKEVNELKSQMKEILSLLKK